MIRTCVTKIAHSQVTVQNDDFLMFADYTSTIEDIAKNCIRASHNVNAHKYFFTNRVCKVWNTLPNSVVEASSYNVLSDYWNMLI